MDELISRQDAIDAICKVWCYTTYGMCPHDDGYCKGCDEIEAIDALPSADAVQGDAISKRFISDAILQKISKLNAQGEKAIPIAREFIRFKRFVDGLTPIRTEAVQVWIPCSEKLPNDNREVLISCEWGIDIGQHEEYGWRSEWINHYDDDNVLAWMPLPTPYKGGDDE